MFFKNLFTYIVLAGALVGLAAAGARDGAGVRQMLPANSPVGTARGIFPGRVVWCHAPGAATWDRSEEPWFADRFNSQEDCDWMMANILTELTGRATPAEAWEAVFTHFNSAAGRGERGYRPGEKIAVKVNNNNSYSHTDSPEINASPHMVLALLRSLVDDAGVPQECITVAEPSRFLTESLYQKCRRSYPQVHYVDHQGGEGRSKAQYVADAIAYSGDNGELARGIAAPFAEADYTVNMALLKGHVGQGVTLTAKNWYGATDIHSDWRKNHHNNFDQDRTGKPRYMTFVDFMGHKDLGGKCVLWLIDGLYGSRSVDGLPQGEWSGAPFAGEWPCSLLGSLDPVALDAVGADILTGLFPDMPDCDYCDAYMVEAAMAGNAPSGTLYDPEGDGTPLQSLGVAEHWNNDSDRQYSRNLGTGDGIELVYRQRR